MKSFNILSYQFTEWDPSSRSSIMLWIINESRVISEFREEYMKHTIKLMKSIVHILHIYYTNKGKMSTPFLVPSTH